MVVLSLFDGMSCGRIALDNLGINPTEYYASEIESAALTVTEDNFPDTIFMGDVTKWHEWPIDWASIDLLIGGSPCQGFSDAGKGLNFSDPRSKLFFMFLDILSFLKVVNPEVKFMLENVQMKKAWEDRIDGYLGVNKIFINACKVSPCYRPRNYWANFKFKPPEDRGVGVKDVISDGFIHPASITGRRINPDTGKRSDYDKSIPISQVLEVQPHDKARCVTTVSKDCVLSSLPPGKYPDAYQSLKKGVDWREPTINELCAFHGIPMGYFRSVSDSAARTLIGNCWNVDVVTHIFKEGLL